MLSTATTAILLLAAMWAIQYGLSFWQMRRYYKRLAELRRDGVIWVGMAGSAWRRRQYAVLVVDPHHRIVHAEQLSGWTVWATLKPVPGLAGRPVSDLLDDSIQLPVSKKLLAAFRHAVQFMQQHAERKAAQTKAEAEDSALANCSA